MPDTQLDFPLELMKLSVRAGSSIYFNTYAKRVQKALQWSDRKLQRMVNNTDKLSHLELLAANAVLKDIQQELLALQVA